MQPAYQRPDHAPSPDRAQRKCLSCTRMFDSHGPGNRICKPCSSLSRSGSPYEPTSDPEVVISEMPIISGGSNRPMRGL